jgi:hypothetical protein
MKEEGQAAGGAALARPARRASREDLTSTEEAAKRIRKSERTGK